jgi:hypothetical protein
MDTHVKVVGWLWIAYGVVSILLVVFGLIALNLNIPGQLESILFSSGILCFFIPLIAADFAAGLGLLEYKSWARILAIIMAVINLIFMCALILPAALAIYTLIIMFNEEAKALFSGENTPSEMEEVS